MKTLDGPDPILTEQEMRELLKVDRAKIAEAIAKLLCVACNVEPIDSGDGSQNWWLWSSQAKDIVEDTVAAFYGEAYDLAT